MELRIGATVIIFYLFMGSFSAQKSQTHYVFTNPTFQNYNMSNGLPSNFCYKTLQDKRGFVWFATFNGLARFDGYHFRYFQQQSADRSYRLPSNWVIDMVSDSSGNIWINTDGGICKYDRTKDSIVNYPYLVRGWGKIQYIAPNRIFVSSYSGIDQYTVKGDSLKFDKNYSELSKNIFTNLYSVNNLLVATAEDQDRIYTISGNKTQTVVIPNPDRSTSITIVNSITALKKDEIILNTKNSGLLSFNLTTNNVKRLEWDSSVAVNDISCSIRYKLGGEEFYFIGTKASGLFVVNTKNRSIYRYRFSNTTPSSILSNEITNLFVDNNNGVWISTVNGVSYFHPSLQKTKPFYFYNNSVFPENASINCVAKVDESNVIIGTESSGIFNYELQNRITTRLFLDQRQVNSISQKSADEFLISTSKGILVYNIPKKVISEFTPQGGSFSEYVTRTKRLNDSIIGVCTKKGVYFYYLKSNKMVPVGSKEDHDQNSANIIKDIYLTNTNELWVLTFFNGYYCYDLNKGIRTEHTPKSLKTRPINFQNISLSKNGEFLYISSTAGIIVQGLKNKGFALVLNSADGLEGELIENVTSDLFSNQIYYTTPVGLYKFNMVTKQNSAICSFYNYKPKWFNCLDWSYDSLLSLNVSNYFVLSKPDLKFNNIGCPRGEISSILVNGKPMKQRSGEIVLPNDQNNIRIEISPNVFPKCDRNYLNYTINNEPWQVTRSGDIELRNLKAGTYKINYYIENSDLVSRSEVYSITFQINELFYNTWPFKILLLFFVVTAISVVFYYRRSAQRRLNTAREQISRDLHDELGANVSSINIIAKLLSNKVSDDEEIRPYVENISNYSLQVSDTINDIIWNVSPKFNTLEDTRNKIAKYASESLDAANINYKMHFDEEAKEVELPDRFKYNIYLIAKEAINNCAKYSQATEVVINILSKKNILTLEIIDNGIGFSETAFKLGNGLTNMQKRAEELNAGLIVRSALNKGTRIELKLKLPR